LISVFPDPEQIYTNHGMVTTMVWCNGEGLTETLVTLVYFACQTATIIQATNKPLQQGDSYYRKAVSLCHNRKAKQWLLFRAETFILDDDNSQRGRKNMEEKALL
jgi:hypothetical protein